MDISVKAAGKRVEVSPMQGGFFVSIFQGFRGNGDTFDGQLQLHVGEDVVRVDMDDQQLVNLARNIDSYLQAVTGLDLWGNGAQVPSEEAEARAYAEAESGPPMPRCADCGAVGLQAGHMECQYPQSEEAR